MAVSTSERKIKKAFNATIEKAFENGFEEDYIDEEMFLGKDDEYGNLYELKIEIHETI